MEPQPIHIPCSDGFRLAGHQWPSSGNLGTVVVNPATGVAARYYHRYARFLATQGFHVVTYDYRGIGLSRPDRLRGSGIRWRHWGEMDFAAVVDWVRRRDPSGFLGVVGHSIGGFLPGFAANAGSVDRMLTMGAQYAWWRNYAAHQRLGMVWRWHVVMPALALALGYFPGRRLGWLEDLPAGVALEWSFRRRRMELSYPAAERAAILERFAQVRASILAVGLSDDEYGTIAAIRSGLEYYSGARRQQVEVRPQDFKDESIGHFGLFHDRHQGTFWPATAAWLRDGTNPWPDRSVPPAT